MKRPSYRKVCRKCEFIRGISRGISSKLLESLTKYFFQLTIIKKYLDFATIKRSAAYMSLVKKSLTSKESLI